MIEETFAQNSSVAHAIERYSADEATVLDAGDLVHVARAAQHDLLGDDLNRRGDIHLALRDRRFGASRRTSKQAIEPPRGHGESMAIIEILHGHPERPVGLEIDQLV